MDKRELELNTRFIEEKIRENEENNDLLKKVLSDNPETVKIWRETNDKIKEGIGLMWTCMDEGFKRAEQYRLKRVEMKRNIFHGMSIGLKLLDNVYDFVDDMDELNDLRMINLAEDAKKDLNSAKDLFSEALNIFTELEGEGDKRKKE